MAQMVQRAGSDEEIALGLLGGGGSIVAVPALVYGVGAPLAVAIPTSLLVTGVSSATAVLPRLRQGQVAWRIAGVFGAAGAGAAFAGAAVNRSPPAGTPPTTSSTPAGEPPWPASA